MLLAVAPGAVKAASSAAASPGAMRAARLHQGETALMRGDAEAAMRAFEQAGALGHDPEIELGLVRSAMQAGRYRQALGFAAHTAGEHAQDAVCLASYLWLLRLGGQDDFARQVWTQASQFKWPEADRAVLQGVQDAWSGHWPQAGGALRGTPLRLAPYAHGHALPEEARLVASGTLVHDAQGVQRVLLPASVLLAHAGQGWWVRNGMGLTVSAQMDPAGLEGIAGTLRPDAPLPGPAMLAPRDPFPGSPAYALAYALGPLPSEKRATASEAPLALSAWPLMKMGFAGGLHPHHGRLLGVEVHAGTNPLGGPVFNAQGKLTGVAIGTAVHGEAERLLPASVLARKGWAHGSDTTDGAHSRMPLDQLYEQGLSSTLQVLVASR